MSYKQIEASREVRLWIGQLIVPAAAIIAACPKARYFIKDKATQATDYIKTKFSKK